MPVRLFFNVCLKHMTTILLLIISLVVWYIISLSFGFFFFRCFHLFHSFTYYYLFYLLWYQTCKKIFKCKSIQSDYAYYVDETNPWRTFIEDFTRAIQNFFRTLLLKFFKGSTWETCIRWNLYIVEKFQLK